MAERGKGLGKKLWGAVPIIIVRVVPSSEDCERPHLEKEALRASLSVPSELIDLLEACAEDREQEGHDARCHTPEAVEAFMDDARLLREHAASLRGGANAPCRHCGASETVHEPLVGTCPSLDGTVYDAVDLPAPSVPAETSRTGLREALATMKAIGVADLRSALFDAEYLMRDKARRDDHEDIDATYFLEGADLLHALWDALPAWIGGRSGLRSDSLRHAFLIETCTKVARAIGFPSDPITDQQSLIEHAERLAPASVPPEATAASEALDNLEDRILPVVHAFRAAVEADWELGEWFRPAFLLDAANEIERLLASLRSERERAERAEREQSRTIEVLANLQTDSARLTAELDAAKLAQTRAEREHADLRVLTRRCASLPNDLSSAGNLAAEAFRDPL